MRYLVCLFLFIVAIENPASSQTKTAKTTAKYTLVQPTYIDSVLCPYRIQDDKIETKRHLYDSIYKYYDSIYTSHPQKQTDGKPHLAATDKSVLASLRKVFSEQQLLAVSDFEMKNRFASQIEKTKSRSLCFNAQIADFFEWNTNIYLLDTLANASYTIHVFGINPSTRKMKNKGSGLAFRVNNHKYSFPLADNNDTLKEKKINDLLNQVKMNDIINIKARIITNIEGHKIIPYLIVDDFDLVKSIKNKDE